MKKKEKPTAKDKKEVVEVIEAIEVTKEVTDETNTTVSHLEEDDDALVLKSYDKMLSETDEAALFEQLENVISWKLINFYDENGKRRNKWALKNDPPIFRLESSNESFAEFVLTKELSHSLAKTFDKVHRGYFNLSEKEEKESTGNKFVDFTNWLVNNPGKTFVLLGILAFVFLTIAF